MEPLFPEVGKMIETVLGAFGGGGGKSKTCPTCKGSGKGLPQPDPSLGSGPGAYRLGDCRTCGGEGVV